jgi:hypothetical protein
MEELNRLFLGSKVYEYVNCLKSAMCKYLYRENFGKKPVHAVYGVRHSVFLGFCVHSSTPPVQHSDSFRRKKEVKKDGLFQLFTISRAQAR